MAVRRLGLAIAVAGGCRGAPLPEVERFPAGTQFTASFIPVDGTNLRYIDAGRGTTVLFIHGLGESIYAWRHTLAAVRAAGFRVVAFDNRGFGSSDKPARGYSNAAYASLVVGLMDSLRVADAVIVGRSMGGAIAGEVAIRRPQRVRGLVLLDAAGLGMRPPWLLRVARWPAIGSLAVALRNRGFVERVLHSAYADPAKLTRSDVDQYYAPVAEPGYGRALRGVLREFRFDALAGRVEHIAAPTLVIWGEEDRWIPIALGRALASQLARSAFLSVRHAGHAVQEEAPEEVNRLLIGFLEQGLPRVPENLAGRPRDAIPGARTGR